MECDCEWFGQNGHRAVKLLWYRMYEPGGHVAVRGKPTVTRLTKKAQVRAAVRIFAAAVAVKAGEARVQNDRGAWSHSHTRSDGVNIAVDLVPEDGGKGAHPLPGPQDVQVRAADARPPNRHADLTRFRRGHVVGIDRQGKVACKP